MTPREREDKIRKIAEIVFNIIGKSILGIAMLGCAILIFWIGYYLLIDPVLRFVVFMCLGTITVALVVGYYQEWQNGEINLTRSDKD